MRRRGRSPTPHHGTNTDPHHDENDNDFLDSDDQNALVASLEAEYRSQAKQFQLAFGLVGGFAMAASLLYPFLCEEECSTRLLACWTHTAVAVVAHGLSILLSRIEQHGSSQTTRSMALLVGASSLTLVPVLLWVAGFFHDDIEHFHLGLVLGNAVTLTGSMLLRWDAHSTRIALEDLNGAKYEHKSL